MKKSNFVWIILLVILLLVLNLAFRYFYYSSFQKNTRQISLSEQQIVLEILNSHFSNIELNDIYFGKVYSHKKTEFVPIKIMSDSLRKEYIIDLTNKRVMNKLR